MEPPRHVCPSCLVHLTPREPGVLGASERGRPPHVRGRVGRAQLGCYSSEFRRQVLINSYRARRLLTRTEGQNTQSVSESIRLQPKLVKLDRTQAQISLAVCADIKHAHYVTVTTLKFSQPRQKRDGRKCTEPQLTNDKLTNCTSAQKVAWLSAQHLKFKNLLGIKEKNHAPSMVCLYFHAADAGLVFIASISNTW